MALKDKKCKNCKKDYTPSNPLQYICSVQCAVQYAAKRKELKAKEERKEAKESLLTKQDYIKILQGVFNHYIRLRDKDEPCISCGCDMTNRKGDASHFFPTTYQYLRFNEDNVHLACVTCNRYKHGNIQEYAPRLEKKIGFERMQNLYYTKHHRFELGIPELKQLITEYKQKVKTLKNDNN